MRPYADRWPLDPPDSEWWTWALSLGRISIEVTNRCAKECRFCDNRSQPAGEARRQG